MRFWPFRCRECERNAIERAEAVNHAIDAQRDGRENREELGKMLPILLALAEFRRECRDGYGAPPSASWSRVCELLDAYCPEKGSDKDLTDTTGMGKEEREWLG